ncbi:hypothetical protein JK359_27445 [Streptomyces actinomycinicus]|uniref:ABC transporter permease n=1 Tax=Streptomyces actinomycinicus TaxID=1695166 RepID=A0A937ELX3_9ACTN|nr:hypothetical protein [Streptomyces actinomycinicus]MBL1085657.1 hypothetical protein [Streptomyces actinomycinicus]
MATRLGPAAEADLTTATATSSGTAPPVRLWLQPTVIALVVVAAFIGCYVGLQRNPQPHRVPVAVAGQELGGEISQVLGESVDVRPVADAATGRAEVERRDVVAALSGRSGSDRLRLEVGGANGQSTTTAVKSLISAYAHGSGQRLTTVDVVPFVRFDSRGLAGFYLAFGVTLAGFVLAQNVLGLANHLHLRHRFWLLSGASVAIGIVATVIAGPILGAVPAPVMPLAFALTLLAGAAAFTTKLLGTYLGPVGVPVATLLLLTVGNSTSGAAIGPDLLPAAAHAVSALLPPGAAVRAVTDLSYFHGAQAVQPLATLALWALIAAILVGLRPRLRRRRTRVAT